MSERREVESFDSISLEGAAKLEIKIGEPLSVLVSGNQASVRRVETNVSGGTCVSRTGRDDWMMWQQLPPHRADHPAQARVLELEGGNDVSLAGLHGGDTTIKAAGAANIKADGELDGLTVRLAGAGHADLSKLAGDRCESYGRWRRQRDREPRANRSMRR